MKNKAYELGRAFTAGVEYARRVAMDDFWITKEDKDGNKYPVLIGGTPTKEFAEKWGHSKKSEKKGASPKAETSRQASSTKKHNWTPKTEDERRVEQFLNDKSKFRAINQLAEVMSGDIADWNFEKEAKSRFALLNGIDQPEINAFRSMNKEIAKDTFHPSNIAGVSRGKEMTHEQANEGRVNPNYNKEKGYDTNCQSAVATYEARRRGYDVEVMPNTGSNKCWELSHESKSIWIDKETGLPPKDIPIPKSATSTSNNGIKRKTTTKNALGFFGFLQENIKDGERYNMNFAWKGRGMSGHVVTVARNSDGKVEVYDPQSGEKFTEGKNLYTYIKDISLDGKNLKPRPHLYRVDNASFNPYFFDDIMKGAGNGKKQG